MATTIQSAVKRIADAIESHFDHHGYEWKTEPTQDEHQQQKPVVYMFVCSKRNAANFPEVCPSITIELSQADVITHEKTTLNIVCHCVVVNSAIIEREKTIKDGDSYHYLDEDGYTDEGVVESLFSDCMLLAEETMNALRAQAGVYDIKLIPPSVLDDFPYCQCQVTATVSMLNQYIPDELL